ncbi:sperm acrosome associated 3 [Cricetulus griseus]
MEARIRAPRRQLCPPGITWLALAYLLSCLLASSKARVFSRCELAKELNDFGLDGYRGYNLADWICLAYYTSGFNTAAVDHEADGSTNNGIFQISSRKWCKNLSPNGPNICRMYCTELGSGWLRGWNLVPLHGQQSGLWKLHGENTMYKTKVEVAP